MHQIWKSAQKSQKVMVKSLTNISSHITMNDEWLKFFKVTDFKHLEATQSKEGSCKTEVGTQIAVATDVFARLNSFLDTPHRVLCKAQDKQVTCALHSCGMVPNGRIRKALSSL
ncbi:hypothetical protein ElyMa_002574600 [Elysia marginata]|uniref:Uncharacterized protein n=1 Tax=Elysia marginata TaxID=1093978 RepID=A0AAV4GZ17_9GAST|nr:hypothetical protein ElyMa_002574600 [Elysia marginata]